LRSVKEADDIKIAGPLVFDEAPVEPLKSTLEPDGSQIGTVAEPPAKYVATLI